MKDVIAGQMDAPKSENFGPAPGGFNVLNVSDATEKAAGSNFFEKVNKPFLVEAIKRNDDIALATIPSEKAALIDPKTGQLLGNFAKEIDFLVKQGYKPVNLSQEKWTEIKGWFK